VLLAALLAFPLATAALAGGLASTLRPGERALLAAAGVALVAAGLASPVVPVHDPWTHFLHLRSALASPEQLLDPWDRPGFTLLAAGPAALGIRAARVAAIGIALVTVAATVRAARGLGLARPWLGGALLLAQPDLFGEATSTMTELPFAAALALAIVGAAEERPWLAAAGLGWLGVTRPEGPALAAVGAALVAARWRRPGPALAALLPLAAWIAAGAAAFGGLDWLLGGNPYHGLVALRLDGDALARSWFFPALWRSQGPGLVALEAAGALLAWLGPARRLRFLLAAPAAYLVLLTVLAIGPTDAWRESRYLVAIGPALALLAAAALDAALGWAPRVAPPLLLGAAASAAAWTTSWQWSRVGVGGTALRAALAAAALAAAALLWASRRRVAPAAAVCLLLLLPTLSAPPGMLSRHRALPAPPPTPRPVEASAPVPPAAPAAAGPAPAAAARRSR
jgi:hypothetical protein